MASSSFNDVWTHLEDHTLCGYCAAELPVETEKCPHCRRKLTTSILRYPKPSSNFTIFLILLVALVQLFMIQVIVDLMTEQIWSTIVWHGLFMPIFAILSVFVFLRKFWAYTASLIALALASTQVGLTVMAPSVFGDSVLGTPLEGLYAGFGLAVSQGIFWILTACLGLAFLVGLIWAAPDFAKDKIWYLAEKPRNLYSMSSSAAHLAAIRYSQINLWALATIHWQRAVAGEPTRMLYYLHLIDAYRRLGFKARALDMTAAASRIAQTAAARAKLYELEVQVNQLPE